MDNCPSFDINDAIFQASVIRDIGKAKLKKKYLCLG